MVSEASTGSIEFSDEEKLLEYYFNPYKGETASIGRRSEDTTISGEFPYRNLLLNLNFSIG